MKLALHIDFKIYDISCLQNMHMNMQSLCCSLSTYTNLYIRSNVGPAECTTLDVDFGGKYEGV
jgi:hypothetical protein